MSCTLEYAESNNIMGRILSKAGFQLTLVHLRHVKYSNQQILSKAELIISNLFPISRMTIKYINMYDKWLIR